MMQIGIKVRSMDKAESVKFDPELFEGDLANKFFSSLNAVRSFAVKVLMREEPLSKAELDEKNHVLTEFFKVGTECEFSPRILTVFILNRLEERETRTSGAESHE